MSCVLAGKELKFQLNNNLRSVFITNFSYKTRKHYNAKYYRLSVLLAPGPLGHRQDERTWTDQINKWQGLTNIPLNRLSQFKKNCLNKITQVVKDTHN